MKTLALNGRLTTLLMAVFLYASFLFGAPTITSLSPSFGPTSGGNTVTIRGSGFQGTTSVDFGPYSATSFTVVSDRRIDVTVPTGAATNVTVSVSSGSGTSPSTPAAIYTYQGDWTGDVTNLSGNSVTVFDIPSDAIITTLGGELSDPRFIVFSSDGSRAYVTNSAANTVEIIDTATQTFLGNISVGTSPFNIAINPAGTRIYVTNFLSNNVSVIDTSTNSVIATIGVGNRPRGIAVTPDGGKAYVANTTGNSVSVIDLATNSVIKTITGFTTPFDIAINPLGTFAYVTQNTFPGTFRVIDTATDTITGSAHTLTGNGARAIAIAPSGLTAYIANVSSTTNNLSVVDLATNTETATISVGTTPLDIAINSTGTKGYVTASGSNVVTVVDLTNNTVSTTISVGLAPTGIAITPDQTQAYVANTGYDSISVIDLASNSVVATIQGSFNNPLGLAINPTGTLVYIANRAPNSPRGITVIDIATNTVVDTITGLADPADIAIAPDGTRAYVTNQTTPGSVDVIDLATNTLTDNIPVGDGPFGIAITPDGTTAYTANLGGDSVSVIDLATNSVVDTITGVTGANVITITPDGTTAYVSNIFSSSVFAIDLSTQVITTITVGSAPEGIAITPDGAMAFVANSGTNTVSVIDIASNSVTATITVGNAPETISITPDGTRAYVTLGNLNEVVVIDITDPTFPIIDTIAVGILPYGVVITPDQAPIASFTFSGTIFGESTHFDASNSRSPVGTIVSYTWNFGDGTVVTTTTDSISHVYSALGSYVVTLTVVNSAGTSTTQIFTGQTLTRNGNSNAIATQTINIIPPRPTVTSIIPTFGPESGGTTVTIHGTNFIAVEDVFFGSTAATSFTVISETKIKAVSPAGTGTVHITVKTTGGTSRKTAADRFTYVAPPRPTITKISPTSGPSTGGTQVTIKGTNFTNVEQVFFGKTPATSFTVTSNTSLTAISPPGTGTVHIRVVTSSRTSPKTDADQFTYLTTGPTVGSISPAFGPTTGRTQVTIMGTNFIDVEQVSFGNTPALSFVVNSPISITAISPPGHGTVDVIVTTATGTSPTTPADQFTYQEVPPSFPLPPSDVKAKQIKTGFGVVNIITWQPPLAGEIPVFYQIFRDAALTKLAATITADQGLKFEDFRRKRHKTYVYYIISVNSNGRISQPVKVKIKP